jgi:magnesium-transporting ATPase (P-type)
MLEAAVALQLARGKGVEAAIIAVPLLFNPAHAYIEGRHARATLADLKSRPALTAIVRRDSRRRRIPAANLVTGDLQSWASVS